MLHRFNSTGSDTKLAFPKQFAPVPPPLVKPKKRDLDEEMRQLERALAGECGRDVTVILQADLVCLAHVFVDKSCI